MPKYSVTLTRRVSYMMTKTVEMVATCADQAERFAMDDARNGDGLAEEGWLDVDQAADWEIEDAQAVEIAVA